MAQGLGAHRLWEQGNEVIQAGGNHPRRERESHEPHGVFHGAPAGIVVFGRCLLAAFMVRSLDLAGVDCKWYWAGGGPPTRYPAPTSFGPNSRHQSDPQTNSVATIHGSVSASPQTHAR